MSQKTHWRNLTDEPNLGHWDLEADGKYNEVVVTIANISAKEHTNAEGKKIKPFIKFKEFAKEMICNKVNLTRLEKKFGTFQHREFVGKQVLLTVEKTKSPQGVVDCLRFSSRAVPSQAPTAKKPITAERFTAACQSIESNTYTADQLTASFALTPDQIKELESINDTKNDQNDND